MTEGMGNRMRLPLAIFGFLLLWTRSSALADGTEFDHPHTNLGSTNHEGKVYSWLDIAQIQLPNSESLPFRLLFSAQVPSGVPLFGKFWWCPFAESTLVPVSERCFLLSTLGGSSLYLVKRKDGTIASGDRAWKGKLGENGLVELNSPAGWTYTYRGGKITDAVSKGGARLHWTYENGLFKSLSDSQKGSLVSFDYGPERLPVRISTPDDTYECGVQKVPVLADTPAGVVVSGFEYSLASMSGKSETWKFPIELSPEGDYSMAFSKASQPLNTYVWDGKSGLLKSERGWTYEVTKRQDGRSLVSRKNKNGGVEFYFYDETTGVSEQKLPDGRVIQRSYFLAGGPTQLKIRSLVKSIGGKEISSTRWSYDDLGRTIREKSGDFEKIWTYHPSGILASAVESYKEKPVSLEAFDEQGRLMKKTRRGIDYHYSYEQGKTILQRIQNGVLTLTEVSDPQKQQSYVFLPQGESGKLEMAQAGSLVKPPQDVAAAQALIERAVQNLKK